jgi:hypothetical protein
VKIRVKINADRATAEFKQARRDVNRYTREGLKDAGRIAVLPAVKRTSPGVVRPVLTVGATTRRGYITTQGDKTKDRITGLLNFGGIVRTVIEPKNKLALTIGNTGLVRANVTKPRRYKGKHFIERGLDQSRPEMERILLPTVMKSFDGLPHKP